MMLIAMQHGSGTIRQHTSLSHPAIALEYTATATAVAKSSNSFSPTPPRMVVNPYPKRSHG